MKTSDWTSLRYNKSQFFFFFTGGLRCRVIMLALSRWDLNQKRLDVYNDRAPQKLNMWSSYA